MNQNKLISIIDYGMGNIGSVVNMVKKAGGIPEVISKADQIISGNKLLLPGVGSFDSGMKNLKRLDYIDAIKEAVVLKNIPILGICLGMQLLLNGSDEGNLEGLKLIDGLSLKFPFDPNFKVPHVGWNDVQIKKNNPLIENDEVNRFYFVHSFRVKCNDLENVLGTTDYICTFDSVISNNSIYGAQFHPEKSHKFGLKLFKKYILI